MIFRVLALYTETAKFISSSNYLVGFLGVLQKIMLCVYRESFSSFYHFR